MLYIPGWEDSLKEDRASVVPDSVHLRVALEQTGGEIERVLGVILCFLLEIQEPGVGSVRCRAQVGVGTYARQDVTSKGEIAFELRLILLPAGLDGLFGLAGACNAVGLQSTSGASV
jgi:hypothetical protein